MKKKIYLIIGLIIVGFPILFSLARLTGKKQREIIPNVISTVPKNSAVFVDEKAEVVITLNRNIAVNEGALFKIKIDPEEKVETVYLENKIRISPETSFKVNTTYKIEVLYKEKTIYLLTFETTPFTPEQISQEGQKQTSADLAYNEAYKEFLVKYPWYPRLPIETKEYRIVYDFEKESFRIRLLVPTKTPEEKKSLIQKALENLKKIGVEEPVVYYEVDYQP